MISVELSTAVVDGVTAVVVELVAVEALLFDKTPETSEQHPRGFQ